MNERWDPPEFDKIKYVIIPLSGSDLSNGYIIEAAFPRSIIEGGFTFAEGINIGFEITIGDNQHDTGRTSAAFFYNWNDYTAWVTVCGTLLKM